MILIIVRIRAGNFMITKTFFDMKIKHHTNSLDKGFETHVVNSMRKKYLNANDIRYISSI